jgi:hypothetical protein
MADYWPSHWYGECLRCGHWTELDDHFVCFDCQPVPVKHQPLWLDLVVTLGICVFFAVAFLAMLP